MDVASSVHRDGNRALILELLYRLDGRSDPSHAHAHTYTGLAREMRQRIGESVLNALEAEWHEAPAENERILRALVGGS